MTPEPKPVRIGADAARPMTRQAGRGLRWLAGAALGSRATAALENELAAGGFVPAHRHDVEELLLCRAGRGVITLADVEYAFAAGDTVVVPPNCVHAFQNAASAPMHVLAFFASARPSVEWIDPDHADGWIER